MTPRDWEQMPYFLAVARLGTLRAAAEFLGATHGTVKRHVEALEASYGVQLFRRTRTGLQLTEAGHTLVPLAENTEALFTNARNRLTGLDREESGTIRFSLTGTMAYDIISPILVRFFATYPGIDLEVRVTDRLEDINRLESDVSLRYAHEIDDDVVARKLFALSLGVYASRSYLETNLPHVGPGGQGLHWIGWDGVERQPTWLADTDFPNANVRHATTDPVMQLHLARHGFGMVKTSVYLGNLYPELVQVPGSKIIHDRTLWILLHSELRRTVRVRRFVEFLSNELFDMKHLLQG